MRSDEKGGKKRSPSAANEDAHLPKKRNKVHEDDDEEEGNRQNKDTADDVNEVTKVEDDNEAKSIERGARVVLVEEARLARGQGYRTAHAVNWLELPTALLGRAFEWLSFTKGRHFFACNSVLWREKCVEYESQMLHVIVLPGMPPCSFLATLAEVHTLDFGPHCTDEHLKYMRNEQVLPKLKHLGMARSLQVTDKGLSSLAENPTRCRTLETLDITFCRRTKYPVTLFLKEKIMSLVLIRRQLEWMDNKRIFPDGDYETCWPDGSFATIRASGEMLECGYYCDLFELDSQNHVTCKQQVVHAPMFGRGGWPSVPEWMRYAYRPAQTFLHCPEEETALHAILHKGTFPMHGFPRSEHGRSIPIGLRATFNLQGQRCGHDDPNKCVAVEHRRPVPLTEWMPPQEVVEKFRTHHQGMERVMAGRNQERDERELHLRTSGQRSDTPPPQWFQYHY